MSKTYTQLQLDFDSALARFRVAADELAAAAKALDASQRKYARSRLSDERKYFNRVVRTYAYSSLGGNFKWAYGHVYSRFRSMMGWHPVCEVKKSTACLLDAIEGAGLLPVATRIAIELLNKRTDGGIACLS